MSTPTTCTVAQALAMVFGQPPFRGEYTTARVTNIINKLLGAVLDEDLMIAELRACGFAHPRPGTGRHLLKWRFSQAGEDILPRPRATRRRPRKEKALYESQKLKPS